MAFSLFIALNANAIDDERVINRMVSTTSFTADEIRADYRTGCGSISNRQMIICAKFQYTAADIELNDNYNKIIKNLKTQNAISKLIKAQKALIVYRDATCEYETDEVEGSFLGVLNNSCLLAVTKSRIVQLRQYMKCQTPSCIEER